MNTLITVQYNTHQPTAQWVGQEEAVMVCFWSWQVDGLITMPSGRPIVWSTCAVVKAVVDVEYYAIMWESTRVKRNVLFRNNEGLKYWTEGTVIHVNKYPMNTETVVLQGGVVHLFRHTGCTPSVLQYGLGLHFSISYPWITQVSGV